MGGRGGVTTITGEKRGFSDQSLKEHYDKHAKEFPGISKKEYNERAIKFKEEKRSKDIEQFESQTGLTFKFNKRTNEFMIYKRDGEIMTYFNPKNPLSYWKTQRSKYEKKQ
jgi:pyocin large subunit-like protein